MSADEPAHRPRQRKCLPALLPVLTKSTHAFRCRSERSSVGHSRGLRGQAYYSQDPKNSPSLQQVESGWNLAADEVHVLEFSKSDQHLRHQFWSIHGANTRYRRWHNCGRWGSSSTKKSGLRNYTIHGYLSIHSKWARASLKIELVKLLQSETKTWTRRCAGTPQARKLRTKEGLVHWWTIKHGRLSPRSRKT